MSMPMQPADRSKRQARWLTWAMVAVFAGSTAGVSLPIWWLIEPEPTISFGSATIYVNGQVTTSVKIGDGFQVSREMCIGRTMSGTVQRELHSEEGWVVFLEAMPIVSNAGCRRATWTVWIPGGTPPGTYSYLARLDYWINPVRRAITVTPPAILRVY